jgi:cis-3-alkyl-4-acyloxetan-2-one decarboxylase
VVTEIAQYPFVGRTRLVNGHRMHYLDEGTGPVLVMVHGNPTWSYHYRKLVSAYSTGYRVICPDHIGCGRSDKPSDAEYDYHLRRRIDDLEELLDAVAPGEELTLVLHDWGGMIGMGYAARHPETIARLVIFNTAAFHLPGGIPFPWQLRLARSPAGAVLVRGVNAFARGATRMCVTRAPMPRDVRAGYLLPYDNWQHRIAVHRFIQDIPLAPGDVSYDTVTEVQRALPEFADTPMLICWGEKDFVFDTRFLTEWQSRFPHARVERFADCGHYVVEDAPEEIIDAMAAFFKAHPVGEHADG